METLEQYFARPDTPMAGSPVGLAMRMILHRHPNMDVEAAREEAREKPFRGTVAQLERFLAQTPEERREMTDKLVAGRAAARQAKAVQAAA